MKQFTSSGKLLLTAEYSVLQGAEAIAVPTVLGQTLSVTHNAGPFFLRWHALDHHNKVWLTADFDQNLNPLNSSNLSQAEFLSSLLKNAFIDSKSVEAGTMVETRLSFNREWGLGSSSTLVHLIAQWSECDPLQLFFSAFKGSGYDVAVAMEDSAIQYCLTNKQAFWHKVTIPQVFNKTRLVYLEQKQNSQLEVKRFRQNKLTKEAIAEITALSQQLLKVASLPELAQIFEKHEKLTSRFLQRKTIKESVFPDFKGSIKSLGAWGGDFIWVIPSAEQDDYFAKKGYHTTRNFSDLVKT